MEKTYFIDGPHHRNIYSQYGEDGVTARIIEDFELSVDVLCEFGAWDGMHFSNTFAFHSPARKLVMIEGDPVKFKDLLKTQARFAGIYPINCYVQPDGKDCLDEILRREGVPALDILSVDIDGYDLKIVKSLQVRPKLIIIEYNPTFGVFKEYESRVGENSGNSFASICEILARKAYSLVAYTNTNLFFVEREIIKRAGYAPFDTEALVRVKEIDSATYQISSAYDGRSIEFGRPTNPWDGCRLARVYRHPEWAYGWEPTLAQVAYRALRTLSFGELMRGAQKAYARGLLKFKGL